MRRLLTGFTAALALAAAGAGCSRPPEVSGAVADAAGSTAAEIVVHKTPWCGCCGSWVDHLRQHGMSVSVVEHEDLTPVRASLGVPPAMTSCHTAEVQGYTIEGHVPAREIQRLLAERPDDVRGLAVPGMPVGSPGMEAGGRLDPYDVLAFGDAGSRTYAEYRP